MTNLRRGTCEAQHKVSSLFLTEFSPYIWARNRTPTICLRGPKSLLLWPIHFWWHYEIFIQGKKWKSQE
jgi:hypothetical protein